MKDGENEDSDEEIKREVKLVRREEAADRTFKQDGIGEKHEQEDDENDRLSFDAFQLREHSMKLPKQATKHALWKVFPLYCGHALHIDCLHTYIASVNNRNPFQRHHQTMALTERGEVV